MQNSERLRELAESLGRKAKDLHEGMYRRVHRWPDIADFVAAFQPILEADTPTHQLHESLCGESYQPPRQYCFREKGHPHAHHYRPLDSLGPIPAAPTDEHIRGESFESCNYLFCRDMREKFKALAVAPLEQAGTFDEQASEIVRRYNEGCWSVPTTALHTFIVEALERAAGQSAASLSEHLILIGRLAESLRDYMKMASDAELVQFGAYGAAKEALEKVDALRTQGQPAPSQTCLKCGGKTWFTANGLCEKGSPDVNAAPSVTPSKA